VLTVEYPIRARVRVLGAAAAATSIFFHATWRDSARPSLARNVLFYAQAADRLDMLNVDYLVTARVRVLGAAAAATSIFFHATRRVAPDRRSLETCFLMPRLQIV
jgi:hypothetical protein